MSANLVRGANTTISTGTAAGLVAVQLSWPVLTAGMELDPSAFLVTASGVVRGDSDFVFYNNETSPEGSVRLLPDTKQDGDRHVRTVLVDVAKIPAEIVRIVLAVTIYQAGARKQTFGQVGQLGARVLDSANTELCRFDFTADTGAEAALVFGELYRRNADWKFRAVGQGHRGGLADLATGLGIEVEKEADPPPSSSPTAAPYPVMEPPPPLVLPADGPRSPLVQRGQRVGLTPGPDLKGELLISLPVGAASGELGCLYELTDGTKGYVGPFGNSWGDYHQKPFVRYFSTAIGDNPQSGEAVAINGTKLTRVERVLVFATIIDGGPATRQLSLTIPGSRPVEVPVGGPGLVAVALVEVSNGVVAVTYLGESFADYQTMDDRYSWGLRWPSQTTRST